MLKFRLPNLNYKKIKIDGAIINYFFKNNDAGVTVLFIHGFTSSYNFIEKILPLNNNYNILSINLPFEKETHPENQEVTLSFLMEILKKFIKNHLPIEQDLVILGHSLGGVFAAKLAFLPEVKEIIFLASFHPNIISGFNYQFLKLINQVQPKKISDLRPSLGFWKTLLLTTKRADINWASMICDPKSQYYWMTQNVILNHNFITEELLQDYQKAVKKPSYFIIGTKDRTVYPDNFIVFVEQKLKRSVLKFKDGGHQLISDKPKEFNLWLNSLYNQN